MRLIIKNPYNIDLRDFCDYIIRLLQAYSQDTSKLSAKLITQWDDYLSVVFPEQNLKVIDILKQFFNHQIWSKSEDSYIIQVDKNIKITGSDLQIEKIAQTIQAGTLDIKGYDIFTQVYEEVASKMSILYKTWTGM